MIASSSSYTHFDHIQGTSTDSRPPSNMPSPQGGNNDLFPLDFLTFSNFDSTSPLPNSGMNGNGDKDQMSGMGSGMEFDLAQFQQTIDAGEGQGQSNNHSQSGHASASGSGSRRGSIDKRSNRGRRSISSLGGKQQGMEVDQQQQQQSQMDFQAMLDAAAASGSHGHGQEYDQTAAQAGLLQQQVSFFSFSSEQ